MKTQHRNKLFLKNKIRCIYYPDNIYMQFFLLQRRIGLVPPSSGGTPRGCRPGRRGRSARPPCPPARPPRCPVPGARRRRPRRRWLGTAGSRSSHPGTEALARSLRARRAAPHAGFALATLRARRRVLLPPPARPRPPARRLPLLPARARALPTPSRARPGKPAPRGSAPPTRLRGGGRLAQLCAWLVGSSQ